MTDDMHVESIVGGAGRRSCNQGGAGRGPSRGGHDQYVR